MATASDLELWVRASRSTANGLGPAITFALGCEVVAVASTTLPMAAIVGGSAWLLFRDPSIELAVLATFARIALVFVPMGPAGILQVLDAVTLNRGADGDER